MSQVYCVQWIETNYYNACNSIGGKKIKIEQCVWVFHQSEKMKTVISCLSNTKCTYNKKENRQYHTVDICFKNQHENQIFICFPSRYRNKTFFHRCWVEPWKGVTGCAGIFKYTTRHNVWTKRVFHVWVMPHSLHVWTCSIVYLAIAY